MYVSTCPRFTAKQTERQIDITTMPDKCNFDSTTYAQKLNKGPFCGVDSIITSFARRVK